MTKEALPLFFEDPRLVRSDAFYHGYYKERYEHLRQVFEHCHVGPHEHCAQCGLDLRNEIHRRVTANAEVVK